MMTAPKCAHLGAYEIHTPTYIKNGCDDCGLFTLWLFAAQPPYDGISL